MSNLSTEGMTALKLTELVEGELLCNSKKTVLNICPINQPKEGNVTFSSKDISKEELDSLIKSKVSALIASKESLKVLIDGDHSSAELSFIAVEHPYDAILKLVPHFDNSQVLERKVSDLSFIDPSAKIGKRVLIQPFCFVGPEVVIEDDVTLHSHVSIYNGASIGANSILHSGVVIREHCNIGTNSTIQNGAVIGAEGFGYRPDSKGKLIPIPQIGTVQTGENVDIGANACIDRGTFGETSIGNNTKIDNLVQVGHNTEIGQSSILCGQAGVAGSCNIGNGVVLGGKVGVADHLTIADGTRFAGGTIVHSSVTKKGDFAGHPAIPSSRWMRQQVLLKNLSGITKSIKALMKKGD